MRHNIFIHLNIHGISPLQHEMRGQAGCFGVESAIGIKPVLKQVRTPIEHEEKKCREVLGASEIDDILVKSSSLF